MTEKPRVRCDSNGTWLADGLSNVVANLGTPRDKASHTTYTPDILDSADLVNAYRTSWLAAAIVDYPAEDATRKWRNWREIGRAACRVRVEIEGSSRHVK